MRRRALLGALAAAPLAAAGAAERLPLRNLRIEWRHGEAAAFEAMRADGGAAVVARDGRVDARAGVMVESRAGSLAHDAVQQLLVLNGSRAALRLGVQQPMHWLQWATTPDGPVAVLGTALVDTGRGIVVQPRWPGGSAPVTVDVLTDSAALAAGGVPSRYAPDGQPLPEGAIERQNLLTTLQLPLGEWVTVARSGVSRRDSERGVLSSRDAARDRQQIVQLRITAP